MSWGNLLNKPRKAVATGSAAMLLIAAPFTAQHEGLRLKAYLDPVGIPTICFGETEGVKMGQVQTLENCNTMLTSKLGMFGTGVDYMVKPEMSPQTHAAFTSFAYNVGIGAFQKSSVLRLYNEGKPIAACNFLTKYVYAGGKVLKGLVKRREAERDLCLSGL